VTCPLCGQRKGRRACPAKSSHICSLCCGTKRRVEIACPDDCPYLEGAHAGGWEGRATERTRDRRRVAAHLAPLSDPQRELFFMTLVGLGAIRQRHREMDDRLLSEAVAALRRTIDTRVRGVLYDHQADDLRAQAILLELRALYEARDAEGRVSSPSDSDLLAALRALEAALADTLAERAGPAAFLESARRLVSGVQANATPSAPAEPRIILP
jgi:hypothetical protein